MGNFSFSAQLKVIKSSLNDQNGQLIPVVELDDELHSTIKGRKDQEIANYFWQVFNPTHQKYITLLHLYEQAEQNHDVPALKRLEKQDQDNPERDYLASTIIDYNRQRDQVPFI